ncbi:HNH endonuclease [Clostridium sp. DL-VIII]|uniref:HNH endonuclease n=1 Tax=Clostridium sp. DL-VIII TaxID=641107 RepID=UPI00023AFE8C|nr:HNH endonuclease [Clostridium sp. DL-VIII]EHI99059.1 HNH endonuclease [Clostridium sp. DL-VIII]
MIKLKKPDDNVKDVFNDCISNFREEFKEKLEKCLDDVISKTDEYEEKISNRKVHYLATHQKLQGLSKEDMIKVYEQKMAKSGQPGRKYYDKFMSIPQYGVCPYCGQGIVSTLDHYLPKTKFVSLIVTPSNLIPSCKDCNKAKTDDVFTSYADTILNPYFDDLGEEIWLEAKVIKDDKNDFVLTYNVIKPDKWSNELFERVKNHFKVFGLNRLYSSHAAQRLIGIKRKLINLHNTLGLDSVLKDLKENVEACSYDPNSWECAMYRELLKNSWVHEAWLELHKRE